MIDKPIVNYMAPDGSWISFRKSMAEFAPSEEEFKELKSKITKIIDRDTTPEFDDTLDFLITLLRQKSYTHATSMSVTKVQKELSELSKQLTNLRGFLENGLSEETQRHMWPEIIQKFDETGDIDAVYALYEYAKHAIEISKKTQISIKGKKPTFTPNTMRQILAEELARELDKMGVQPKKYRNGEFVNILKTVLRSISCRVYDTPISISIPSDLFKVASKAIDDFPTKDRYSLLNIE